MDYSLGTKGERDKMKPTIIAILLILLVLPVVVAQEQIVRQNSEVYISHEIRVGGAPSTALVVNISVEDPFKNSLVNFSGMTNNLATQKHNYTIPSTDTSHLGLYKYCITATDTFTNDTECFQFEVTLIGEKATTSQSLVFFFVGFLSIVLFLLSLFGAIKIPFKNTRNQQGFVVNINDLKYVKIVLWFVTYILAIFITFSFRHVAQISNWDVGSRVLGAGFWFLIVFLLPAFVILFLTGFMSFFNDKRLNDMIGRNIQVR